MTIVSNPSFSTMFLRLFVLQKLPWPIVLNELGTLIESRAEQSIKQDVPIDSTPSSIITLVNPFQLLHIELGIFFIQEGNFMVDTPFCVPKGASVTSDIGVAGQLISVRGFPAKAPSNFAPAGRVTVVNPQLLNDSLAIKVILAGKVTEVIFEHLLKAHFSIVSSDSGKERVVSSEQS